MALASFIALALLPAKWAEGAGKPSTPKIHLMLILGFDRGVRGHRKGPEEGRRAARTKFVDFFHTLEIPRPKRYRPEPRTFPARAIPKTRTGATRRTEAPRKAVFRTSVPVSRESRGLESSLESLQRLSCFHCGLIGVETERSGGLHPPVEYGEHGSQKAKRHLCCVFLICTVNQASLVSGMTAGTGDGKVVLTAGEPLRNTEGVSPDSMQFRFWNPLITVISEPFFFFSFITSRHSLLQSSFVIT